MYARVSFLGVFQFRAPFLPWALLGFSVLLGNSPTTDLLGIGAGHVYYFLEDVHPYTAAGRGRRVLVTPRFLRRLLDPPPPPAVPNIRRLDDVRDAEPQ